MSLARNRKLTNEILANRLSKAKTPKFNDVIYIDSSLAYRKTLFVGFWFDEADYPFEPSTWEKTSFQYIIPDSLRGHVKYITNSESIGTDTASYRVYSPLLPTKEKGVYAMQAYTIGNIQEKDIVMRLANREIYYYKISGNKITSLENLYENEGPYTVYNRITR